MKIKSIFQSLLDLFYPPLCAGCYARLLSNEEVLCLHCFSAIPYTQFHLSENNKLEQNFLGRVQFNRAYAMAYFSKNSVLQHIIHAIKYNDKPEYAYYLGQLYGNILRSNKELFQNAVLVPVPLHPKRLKSRGYNQAEEICKGIVNVLPELSINTQCVVRKKNNPTQTHLNKAERLKNVENIFQFNAASFDENNKIIIVDDVITSGATIVSLINAITEHLKPQIDILSIAFAYED